MDRKQQKEQFSQAYVQAIAACAGFAWSKPSVDEDSVDLMLSQRGGRGTIRSPRLEIQLKCTEKEAILGEDGTFPFSIPRKNYDDLRDITLHVPRILVVVFVPADVEDWLSQKEEELVMRRCGYWANLRGRPESQNEHGQTIRIPNNQRFTVAALQGIMERVGEGGQL
jgi:hypothetical protein